MMRCGLRIVCLFVAMLAAATPGVAASWCGASAEDNWRELGTVFSGGAPSVAGRPTVFIWGAPWCPYCAELFRTFQAKPYRLNVKFVPGDSRNDQHARQITDIVTDGGINALVRTYVQKSAPTPNFSEAERKFINDVQTATGGALQIRFQIPGGKWGSPTAFLFENGQIRALPGMLNFAEAEKHASGPEPWSADISRRFLKSGIPPVRKVSGAPASGSKEVRLRVLPHNRALTAFCLPKNSMELPAPLLDGLIEVDGQQWMVLKGFFEPRTDLRLYALASEFRGWSLR